MEADLGKALTLLRVDGGASQNDLLMQFQADVLNVPLSRPEVIETTALGAAILAGLGSGIFSDLGAAKASWRENIRLAPGMSEEERGTHMARWREGLARV